MHKLAPKNESNVYVEAASGPVVITPPLDRRVAVCVRVPDGARVELLDGGELAVWPQASRRELKDR